MSSGNSLLCRRLEAVLLKRDRIKGETTHEEWIWFEHKVPSQLQPPSHTQPHTWDVHQEPAEVVTTFSTAPRVSPARISLPMAAAAPQPRFFGQFQAW